VSKDLLTLRPYQREAIDAVTSAWADGVKRPAVVLPTGMGKTVVFAHLAAEFHKANGGRAVILVHRDELADQAVSKLRSVAPHLWVGKVKASDNDVNADVVVASVQTLASEKRRNELLNARSGGVGLVISDECHHSVAPTYKKIYEALGNAYHVGFTATLARSDGVGLGSVWDDVVYSKTLAYAVKHGFLVQPRGRSVKVDDLNLSSVKKSRGDFQSGDLGDALEHSSALTVAADAYLEHAKDRRGVVFTPTVATAQITASELTLRGIPSAVISGETPRSDRLRIYEAYRTGAIQVLSNCMVLTEGFDAPWASCAVIVRPTQSNPLYIQMVGRVLRPFPGKTDALVLDVVGASQSNKLSTLIDLEEGFFKERQPCKNCDCLPCECICEECGVQKPCECPPIARPELVAVGSGGDFDLFSSSKSAWGQTPKGVWFVSCGQAGYIFLWPTRSGAAGTWDVYMAPLSSHGVPLKWRGTDYTGMPLETAMAWAEAEAEELGATLTLRGARWRKNPASEAQYNLARAVGCILPEGLRKGEAADMISKAKATRVFDPYVGAQ
jgi:superfamily II DNA or RNA helicase